MFYKSSMTKNEFRNLVANHLRGCDPRNPVNPNTGLGIRSFSGWEDWYSYGEWDCGPMEIVCAVDNRRAEKYLLENGFTQIR